MKRMKTRYLVEKKSMRSLMAVGEEKGMQTLGLITGKEEEDAWVIDVMRSG